jgi:hypothetical protein
MQYPLKVNCAVRSRPCFNLFADETIESLEKRAAETIALDSTDEIPEPRSVTYKDYENPFSLVSQGSGAPQIAKLSPYAWVGCGEDIYVLECLGKGHVRIEPVEGDRLRPRLCLYSQSSRGRSTALPRLLFTHH